MRNLLATCLAMFCVTMICNAQSPCSSVIDKDVVTVVDTKGQAVRLTTDTGDCDKDADKDGIADADDKCPSVPGVKENGGCPAVDEETREALAVTVRDLRFKTGSAELEEDSKKILDKLAVILLKPEHKLYKISIEGHTDNTGSDEINNKLSADRANAAMNYLIKDGVPAGRLKSAGFGSSKPMASNDSEEGRKKNRRVEFNVFF